MARSRPRPMMPKEGPGFPSLEPLVLHLTKLMTGTTESFDVRVLFTATVLMKDGSYKKGPVHGGTEFFWKGIRQGKRGDLIFSFEPADPQPWKAIELNSEEVNNHTLNQFSVHIEDWLGTTLNKAKVSPNSFKDDEDEKKPAKEPAEEVVDYTAHDNWGTF